MEDIANLARRKKTELSFSDIKKSLLHRFLYQGDSDAIQILLNIYKIEERIDNVFPSYISIKSLKKDILSFLKDKVGKELIASNISQIIHDDINRLELVVYLFGYRKGLKSFHAANELEILTLKYFTVEDLYTKPILFHYECENKEVLLFKESLLSEMKRTKFLKNNLVNMLNWYNKNVLKKKIYSLNEHVDRQILINTESDKLKFIEVENHLNYRELRGLNKKLMRFLYRDGVRVYETAFWNGLNDLVLRRYDM